MRRHLPSLTALQCFEASARHLSFTRAAAELSLTQSAVSRQIKKLEGSHPVQKFAAAEFAWMKDINNGSLTLKLLDAVVKAEQFEFGHWFAPKALNILQKQKKPSKNSFLQAKTCLAEIGAWREALLAGEIALSLDPMDAELEGELKDLSAQRAMLCDSGICSG